MVTKVKQEIETKRMQSRKNIIELLEKFKADDNFIREMVIAVATKDNVELLIYNLDTVSDVVLALVNAQLAAMGYFGKEKQ